MSWAKAHITSQLHSFVRVLFLELASFYFPLVYADPAEAPQVDPSVAQVGLVLSNCEKVPTNKILEHMEGKAAMALKAYLALTQLVMKPAAKSLDRGKALAVERGQASLSPVKDEPVDQEESAAADSNFRSPRACWCLCCGFPGGTEGLHLGRESDGQI